MLRLTNSDLGPTKHASGRAGVILWWRVAEGRKRAVECLAWDHLALIRPELSWPPHVLPERESSWRKRDQTMRLTWVEGLGRVLIQVNEPAPSLEVFDALKLSDSVPASEERRSHRVREDYRLTRVSTGVEDPIVYLPSETMSRIRDAIGDVQLRVKHTPGGPTLLAYRARALRAIATCSTETEVWA